MRKVTARFFVASLCVLSAVAAVQPAAAQTVRAYALVETAQGSPGTVVESLRGLSLMNCLQLVETLVPSEVVAHIECNDLASLNEAVTKDIPKVEGVSKVTLWSVTKGE
jgi:hypothetical protein